MACISCEMLILFKPICTLDLCDLAAGGTHLLFTADLHAAHDRWPDVVRCHDESDHWRYAYGVDRRRHDDGGGDDARDGGGHAYGCVDHHHDGYSVDRILPLVVAELRLGSLVVRAQLACQGLARRALVLH